MTHIQLYFTYFITSQKEVIFGGLNVIAHRFGIDLVDAIVHVTKEENQAENVDETECLEIRRSMIDYHRRYKFFYTNCKYLTALDLLYLCCFSAILFLVCRNI